MQPWTPGNQIREFGQAGLRVWVILRTEWATGKDKKWGQDRTLLGVHLPHPNAV